MKPIHTSVVTSRGGRSGRVRSSDGILDLDLRRPADGGGTNPEQLFAAGFAACFEGAFRLAARNAEIPLGEVAITVHVTLNAAENQVFDLSAEIHGQADGLPIDQTSELMNEAHRLCPYSRVVRGNMEVQLFPEIWAQIP